MAQTQSPKYVYAGLTRWGGGGSKTAKPNTLGGVFRMKVGDYKWQHMMQGFPEVVHVHCLTVHPEDPAVILAGTHDGPFRSTDRGETWQRLDFETRDMLVWSICFHPQDPRVVFAGTSPVGIYRSDDGGESWKPVAGSQAADRLAVSPFINRVMRFAIDPTHPDEIYAAMEVNGAMRSLDGGITWEDCNDTLLQCGERPEFHSKVLTDDEREGMLDAHAICVTPARPHAPIIALRMGLFAGNNRGEDWEDLGVGRFSTLTYARDIRVAPQNPDVLYACLSDSSHGVTGSLCRSEDAGLTWRRIDHSVSAATPAMAVALDADDPEMIFFTTRSGQVFGTENGGKTWREDLLPKGCNGVYALLCA
jgi:hypothetical protein